MSPPTGPRPNRPDPATPLAALEAVALDLETTGLDVAEDRVVQIGAIRIRGGVPVAGEVLDLVVDPGVPVPPESSRIHGLTDADVAGAQGTAEALARLAGFAGDAVVVGHSLLFDLAVLRHEAARHGVDWAEPPALDTELIAAALTPGRMDSSLEAVALGLGVVIEGRHTALGDARAAADVLAALLAPLEARGIRSLGDLEAFQRRPGEMIARRERAGWFARPGAAPGIARAGAPADMQQAVDGFLYRHRLADVMGAPPVSIAPGATLLEAARLMRDHAIGCLVVEPLAAGGGGFLSERDVIRAFAGAGAGAAGMPVSAVMSAPVIAMPEDSFLYRALARMARRRLRSLVATGPGGAVSGVFTLRGLLQQRALAALAVGDGIATAGDAAALAAVRAELPRLAAALLADGLEARQVAAVIASEERAMTARAAELAEQAMLAAGRGPAPAAYCLLVLGSAGRGESLLAPDQDNAVIVADGYAGDLDSAEDWFALWGGHLNRILDEAGIPLCPGAVMVRNRAWRRRLGEWRAQIDAWAANPEPEHILNADIFLDFAPVAGEARHAEALRRHALATAGGSRMMLAALAEAAGGHGRALESFGGFRKDAQGRTDLKEGGLVALVAGARAMALARGIAATATPERLLQASAAAGPEDGAAEARMLSEVHGMLLRLLLEQQIADIDAGVPPSNAVDTGRLGRDQRKRLKQALDRLVAIDEMVRRVLG